MRMLNHAIVAWRFARRARACPRPDLIFCSFPTIELSAAAVALGRRFATPVVLDIRDLWPDAFLSVTPPSLKWAARIALWPYFQLARYALAGATGLVAISDGYMKWGLAYARRAKNPVDGLFALGYARAPVAPAARDRALANLRQRGLDPEKHICWFVGSFGQSYDLLTVLQAARLLDASHPGRYQFVISGAGDQESALRAEAQGIESVMLTGWVDEAQIEALGMAAHIGLQPYKDGAFQGLPNKLFEYLSFGLPVISSLQGECAELLAAEKIGFTYEAGNHESLARCLSAAFSNRELLVAAKRRAQEVFRLRFDASLVYPQLATHLETQAAIDPGALQGQGKSGHGEDWNK